jgi:membrane protease YdiL (CAAX protease family)
MPPPAGPPAHVGQGHQRPWWGFGDVLLGIPFFFAFVLVGTLIGLLFTSLDDLVEVAESGDTTALPLGLLGMSLIFQQVGQGIWPFVVSKWKGLGAVTDWRLRFEPIDLALGLGVAFIGLAAAGFVGWATSELVGLTDEASADNTQFLRDAEDSPWLILFLFAVVIGAPVSEELFFRGLTLRAIEKRAGKIAAVFLSAAIFTLPHFTGTDIKGTTVLFASIFCVGVVLGAAAIITDRIASSIIAHMIFNAIGAIGALGWFDSIAS